MTFFSFLLALAATVPAADVAYREIFPSGPNAAASGWHLNHSNRAWVGDQDQCWGAGPGAGAVKAINSLTAQENDQEGWKGFVWLVANSPTYLFWTEECAFAERSVERVAWRFSAKDPAAVVHVALRVGEAWYASTQTISDASGADIKTAKEFSIEVAQTTWIPFTWQANAQLPDALGGAGAALPAGSITGFGFLATGRTQTHSYDGVEVLTTKGVIDATPRTK